MRFYIKYVFLEVFGQTKLLSENAKAFIKDYLEKPDWREHFIDSVFIGHSVFVEYLLDAEYLHQWFKSEEDKGTVFSLLYSVNTSIQNKIATFFHQYAFKSEEIDSKIYTCLCRNIEDDSEKMFKFRLELLNKSPQILNVFIDWKSISTKSPNRAIILFETFIKNRERINYSKNSPILDKDEIPIFINIAKENVSYIWDKFMPYISENTKDIDYIYDEKLKFWLVEDYPDQNFGRTYIKMIIEAAKILIDSKTDVFILDCNKYFDNKSLVVNEIMLNIMESLPCDYSDFALNWLIEKPNKRLFNYTGENDEYLYTSKEIIEKHSKYCSDEVFRRLENFLYYFHEKDELQSAKNRFDYNRQCRKEGNMALTYYPYWGKVQYYLLPALDSNRTSKEVRDLIKVLERRFANYGTPYIRSRTKGGSVGSTIGSIAEKLSDKQWIKVICNNKPAKSRTNRWIERDGDWLESSPQQFSRDLERIGRISPNRIARLALKLSINIDSNYISAIFNVIGEKKTPENISNENWEPVTFDLAQKIFVRFKESIIANDNVTLSFCRAIEQRAEEKWDSEIISILSDIAINSSNPLKGQMNIRSYEDKKNEEVEMIHSNSYNCGRGCAARSIALLLWENKERYTQLTEAINSVVYDNHLAVNMAAIECIRPVINFDREIAVKWFFDLADKDIRIIAHPLAYDILYYFYKDNAEIIKQLVLRMYTSIYDDVMQIGARHIANFYLLYDWFEDIIFDDNKTLVQKKGILDIVTDAFQRLEFDHEKCKGVLEFFLNDKRDDLSHYYSKLFYQKKIDVRKDRALILKIVEAKSNKLIIRSFLKYISEADSPLQQLKDIIYGIYENMIQNVQLEVNDIRSNLYGTAPMLSTLIARLYDETQSSFDDNQKCLDMWDMMFKNRIGTMRELSRSIMNV